jgi:hypothetical protein
MEPLTRYAHPFLFSIYSVVALFVSNAAQMDLADVARPLLLSLGAAVLAFAVLWLLLRNGRKAALITSLGISLFFTYGHIYFLAKASPVLAPVLGRQSILVVLWLVLFVAGTAWILRAQRMQRLDLINRFLSVMALVALVMPLGNYGFYLMRSSSHASEVEKIDPVKIALQKPQGQPLPDIYYIILDMYARDDVMSIEIQWDNKPFLSSLEQMGFQVARCSQSNYTQTELSLSSSLNMNYLPAIDSHYVSGYMDRSGLPPLIKDSVVRRSLTALGYKTVAFQTEYPFINLTDADLYLAPATNSLGYLQNDLGASPFEAMLLKTTAGLALTSFASPDQKSISSLADSPFKQHIAREEFLLDKLPNLTDYSSPKFVYAHILIPHGPMVFGPDGPLDPKEFIPVEENNQLKDQDFIVAYRKQVEYINNRMLPILRTIIERSKTPPIIIVQGDHGPWVQPEILNAYYLPNNGGRGLYPKITPVNSFRLIFNNYFGTNYPLLPDQSFSSNDYNPFGGTLYPNTRQDCTVGPR